MPNNMQTCEVMDTNEEAFAETKKKRLFVHQGAVKHNGDLDTV
jgi:hypothetical protein